MAASSLVGSMAASSLVGSVAASSLDGSVAASPALVCSTTFSFSTFYSVIASTDGFSTSSVFSSAGFSSLADDSMKAK